MRQIPILRPVHRSSVIVPHRHQWLGLTAILLSVICSSPLHAEEFRNALSFQGYTGILNVPTAELTTHKSIDLLYTNQVEPLRFSPEFDNADNYIFSMGLLPYIELGGRMSTISSGLTDLSGNAKFQVPLFHRYLPKFAVGIQDFGGGKQFLRTSYAVMSKEVGRLRATLGYGIGPDRLDGGFAGGEVKLFDWLYLLGDHDTDRTNAGVRIATGKSLFALPIQLHATAQLNLSSERSFDQGKPNDFSLALGLRIPLGKDYTKKPSREPKTSSMTKTSESVSVNTPRAERGHAMPYEPIGLAETDEELMIAEEKSLRMVRETSKALQRVGLQDLKEELIELGFENVKVGVKNSSELLIEYENNRYNQNELDGLGLVFGVAVVMPDLQVSHITVLITEVNIPMLKISVSRHSYRDFLFHKNTAALRESMVITQNTSQDGETEFVGGPTNSSLFKGQLFLYPGLQTFVGSEVGAVDYSLDLKADLFFTIWKGGMLNALGNIPVEESGDFENGRVFEDARQDLELENLLFHQTFKLMPEVTTMTSAGLFQNDYYAVMNEAMWNPGRGHHRLRTRVGHFEHESNDSDSRNIWLGSYRYLYDPLDLYVEATAGQFWFEDQGATIELTRLFGDTAITLFYKGTDMEDAGGLQITIPLTPRRDMYPRRLQVRGLQRWSHGVQTTIRDAGNTINTRIAVVPETIHTLERIYFNDDRLNELYIVQNLPRLRDAYHCLYVHRCDGD